MRELEKDFERDGIAVRFVVIGDITKARRYCSEYGMSSRCIPDPKKETYAAMGFGQYNLLKLFSDPALKERRKENRAAGFHQNWGATRLGDSAQLPGAAVINRHGIIAWRHAGVHPGDLPPMREMLEIARAATAS
ncbi:MAG: AhpC/TSA family protein [Candidatus Eremiobacteraeota bacterium]|nr:AhpC/TSA family protein [Candidatus Eremiobacteraeota bacterium]